LAAIGTVLAAVFIGGTGFASWTVMGSALSYERPALKAPLVAKRLEGVMKEFPIDTDADPAKPESVVAETYAASGSASDVKLADKWVPKGVKKETLPKRVRTLTAARYRRKGADSPVQVTVMEPQPGTRDLGKTLSAEIGDLSGSKQTGITVENPDGATYTGTRTQTSSEQIYVLERDDTGTTIVVSAEDPSEWSTADRLAQNVGNGDGLLETPEGEDPNPVWLLPAELPPGLELTGLESMTLEELMATEEVRGIEAEAATNRELAEAWKAGILDYDEPRQSWLVWQFFKSVLVGRGLNPVDVRGAEGRLGKADGKGWIYFQRGPFIGVIEAPGSASTSTIQSLGESFQI